MRNFTVTLWWNYNKNGLNITSEAPQTIDLTINDDGTLKGSGFSLGGAKFTIGGTLIGDNIRFVQYIHAKEYSWKYLGSRVAPNLGNTFQFAGSWSNAASVRGAERPRDGLFVIGGVDNGATVPQDRTKPHSAGVPTVPYNLVEGFWTGHRKELGAAAETSFIWSLGLDSTYPYSESGPYRVTGIGCDSAKGFFRLTGTVTKAAPNATLNLQATFPNNEWTWELGVEPDKGDGEGIFGDAASKVLGILHVQRVAAITKEMAVGILPWSNTDLGAPSASLEEFQAIHRVIVANPDIPTEDLYQLVWNFTS